MIKNSVSYLGIKHALMAATCFGAVAADPEIGSGRKSLPADVINTWTSAGAKLGFMNDLAPELNSDQFWDSWREKVENNSAIPAFRFSKKIGDKDFSKLAHPTTAFGLDFHCGYYAGVSLKEIAKLKNLQSLSLGAANQGIAYSNLKDLESLTDLRALYLFRLRIDDSQIKHLLGMKNLLVLDLSHTQVTEKGLKDLEKLKNLQWLNLRGVELAHDSVTSLQKTMPRCKILYGGD